MAFIICDDHNLDVEADGIDNAVAKQLMLTDANLTRVRSKKRSSSSAESIATATSESSPADLDSIQSPRCDRRLDAAIVAFTRPRAFYAFDVDQPSKRQIHCQGGVEQSGSSPGS